MSNRPDAIGTSVPSIPLFQLGHDAWGRLVLTEAGGVQHVDVVPVRAFPLSDARSWISICSAEGKELLGVPRLDDLPSSTRTLLEAELARREFLPTIERIVEIEFDAEPMTWTVETDRGRTTFAIEGNDAVRRTGTDRCLITDVQGVRYLIADRKRLDAPSRRLLDLYF